jgi:hypothetical protein
MVEQKATPRSGTRSVVSLEMRVRRRLQPEVLTVALQINNLGQREYAQLIKAAGLRPH